MKKIETCFGCKVVKVAAGHVCADCALEVQQLQQLLRAVLGLEPIRASRGKPAKPEPRFRTWREPGTRGDGMVMRHRP